MAEPLTGQMRDNVEIVVKRLRSKQRTNQDWLSSVATLIEEFAAEHDRLAAECVRLTEQNERLDLDHQAAVHRSNEATKQAALEKIARKAADRDNEQLQRDKAYYMRHSERWHQTTSARFETVTDECDHWRAEVARYRTTLEAIAKMGVGFDAKGTRSKQINEMARAALAGENTP